MPFYKKTSTISGNLINLYEGETGCCGETASTKTCTASFTTSGTTIDSIVIDGTTKTFSVAADTIPKLKVGIHAAFVDEGYEDIIEGGLTVEISGANTVVTVVTTAATTKMITSLAGDVDFTCV